MPVVQRKLEEAIQIGRDIRVTVIALSSGRVKLHVEAPRDVQVSRVDGMRKAIEKMRTAVAVKEATG